MNGINTGLPSRPQSVYELWVEHVKDGKVKNKDGSNYTGGITTIDYNKWLQGGDISVLYLYWKNGNEINKDKSMDEFIKELFDCHCDGISLNLVLAEGCFEMNEEGKVVGELAQEVKLFVMGDEGTTVNLVVDGQSQGTGTIDNTEQVEFPLIQTDKKQQVELKISIPNKKGSLTNVTKNLQIPAIKTIDGIVSFPQNRTV